MSDPDLAVHDPHRGGVRTSTWRPPTRRVQVGRTLIRIADVGEGPPLLLINGIGGNIEMWEPVASRLQGRRLVMFDIPGCGESPPLPRRLRMPGYARLVASLLDVLRIDRADVLGYSWGGALAQQVAVETPGRVRSLALCATIPGLGGRPPAPWVVPLMATPARYYSRSYLRWVSPALFGSDPEKAADSVFGDARLARPPSVRGYSQQLYAVSGWTSRPWLRRLDVPTLVLAGERDPLAPVQNAHILARCIRGAQLHLLDAGHLFLLEEPDEAVPLLERFLREQDVVDAQPRPAA